MKILYQTLLTIMMTQLATSVFGQDIPQKYAALSHRIHQINRDHTLQRITLTGVQVTEYTTDGGAELTGYFKAGKLQKMTRTTGLSDGIETFDYYFDQERLVFIYELFEGFMVDSTGTVHFDSTETNFIGRYYFRDNKLIDNETTGHNRFEDDEVDMQGTLLAEMKDGMRRIKREWKKKTSGINR